MQMTNQPTSVLFIGGAYIMRLPHFTYNIALSAPAIE
jgi:hypothetical protein